MKSLPLQTKLLVVVSLSILLLGAVLVWRSYAGITGISDLLTTMSEKSLKQEAIERLKTETLALSEQVSGYINSAYSVALTTASIASDSIQHPNERLNRVQLSNLLEVSLSSNTNISSIYAHFEANAYDGQDANYVNSNAIHSTKQTGSFESYWIREDNGKVVAVQVKDPEEKYDAETDENGIRVGEWYLCGKEQKKPCIMEPTSYEIRPGYTELMTSLTAPVLVNGQFRGLVGLDINLPRFQELAEKLSASLYQGQAKVTLLSAKGAVVAASHYQDKLTQRYQAVEPELATQLIKLYQQGGVLETADKLYVSGEIPVRAANDAWSILIEVPKAVVLAQIITMKAEAESETAASVGGQVLLSIIMAGLMLSLVVLLIRSIVQPINNLQRQVAQLASADGDLSQRLTIDAHAELIGLGGSFNQFIQKLRDMVLALKDVSAKVRNESSNNLRTSLQTTQATDAQQNEITNVVTATQEMSATAQQVASIAADVATRANDIQSEVSRSQRNISTAVASSLELTDNMNTASSAITQVSARSEDINRILVVIGSIAEQTNLLALNAAIEAARAGEQGRGFAVVADEVRTLASKTQSSTAEIRSMIDSLQNEVKQAVSIIELGRTQATGAMEQTQQAHESLQKVVDAITAIADHIHQVATAAEEQSSVSEEITRNLTVIGDAARTLSDLAQHTNQSSKQVTGQLDELDFQLSALRNLTGCLSHLILRLGLAPCPSLFPWA